MFSQTAEHEHKHETDEESVFFRKFTSVQTKSLNTFVWRSVQVFPPLNTEHLYEIVTTKNTKIVSKLTCGQVFAGVFRFCCHMSKHVFRIVTAEHESEQNASAGTRIREDIGTQPRTHLLLWAVTRLCRVRGMGAAASILKGGASKPLSVFVQ